MSTRVLLHTDATTYGGAERALRHLAGAIHPSVRVIVAGPDERILCEVAQERSDAELLVLPVPSGRYDARGLVRLRRALASAHPDLVHLNLSWAGSSVLPTLAALLLGVPVVAVEQLSLPVGSRKARVVKRLLSSRLSAHVAVGERAAREIERDNGLRPGSLLVVHNGVPDTGRRDRPPATGPAVVGALARFHSQKGLDVLLHALVDVPGCHAVLAGGGEEETALRLLVAELHLADRVELHGWVPDSRALLHDFDVLVLPSRYEGFPLSVVEAMLAGVPVVATDVGSTREAVHDGQTGWLVPPDDAAALAGALRRALQEPTATVEAARRLALERFTDQAMAAGFEQIYAVALGRSVGRAAPRAAVGG